MNEAFARYLGRGRPAYVEKPLPTLQQVAELVHAVGGIAVAAHLGDHGSEGQIRQFQEQGLDGLEVRHPSHSPGTERRITCIAQSEEHTSELQSLAYLVCRLLLEKKKKIICD